LVDDRSGFRTFIGMKKVFVLLAFLFVSPVIAQTTVPLFSFHLSINFWRGLYEKDEKYDYVFINPTPNDSLGYDGFVEMSRKVKLSSFQIKRLFELADSTLSLPAFENMEKVQPSSNLFILQMGTGFFGKELCFSDSIHFQRLIPLIRLLDSFVEEDYRCLPDKRIFRYPVPKPNDPVRYPLLNYFNFTYENMALKENMVKQFTCSFSDRTAASDSISYSATARDQISIYCPEKNKKALLKLSQQLLDKCQLQNKEWHKNKPGTFEYIQVAVADKNVSISLTLREPERMNEIKELREIIRLLNKNLPSDKKISRESLKATKALPIDIGNNK
jgi:hypothetical protein